MIRDAVPAYITWERYLANQERLASNRNPPTTARPARPLTLGGVAGCGRCVRMRVAIVLKELLFITCIGGATRSGLPKSCRK